MWGGGGHERGRGCPMKKRLSECFELGYQLLLSCLGAFPERRQPLSVV